MGDYASIATFSDPVWAPPRVPRPRPLPYARRRRARTRSCVILAVLIIVGFFFYFALNYYFIYYNHYLDGAHVSVVRVPLVQGHPAQAARPETQLLELPDALSVNATQTAQREHPDPSPRPDPDPDPDSDLGYCTTWPVDHQQPAAAGGSYAPKPEPRRDHGLYLDTFAPASGWQKPRGLKVVAVVFYGRRRNVDVLDCYLQQNLASNGGYLDDVWFMVHTREAADVAWLNEFVKKDPLYKFKGLGSCGEEETYGCIWENMVENDTLYIKIDDDILYIHHDAIPQLVHTRLAQPHPYAVSAQLVNSPVTGLQQYHYGAIHAFLPDPSPSPSTPRPSRCAASRCWRPSHFDPYPADAPLPAQPLDLEPPYRGHPWLLLATNSSSSSAALKRTPIGYWSAHPGNDPVAFGPGWKSWAVAAQQQYSLLRNLELNQVHVYHFGRALDYGARDANDDGSHSYYSSDGHYHRHQHHHYAPSPPPPPPPPYSGSGSGNGGGGGDGEGYAGPGGEQLYDTQYERYNLNFAAIWGRDVALALPIAGDDEEALTVSVPLRLGRPFVIDTRAVVSHLSFYTQRAGVEQTDLMDRWRAFANENVCSARNQKMPWDKRCEGF